MLPADAYARYMRARGHEVQLICATDEHGTPAELAAAKAGQSVADYCAEMWTVQKRLGEGFRLSFDYFGRSSSQRNHQFTQHLAGRLADAGLIEEVSEKQVYSNADGLSRAPARNAAMTAPAATSARTAPSSSTRPT
jgi:methionyl-tRNA synthetase